MRVLSRFFANIFSGGDTYQRNRKGVCNQGSQTHDRPRDKPANTCRKDRAFRSVHFADIQGRTRPDRGR